MLRTGGRELLIKVNRCEVQAMDVGAGWAEWEETGESDKMWRIIFADIGKKWVSGCSRARTGWRAGSWSDPGWAGDIGGVLFVGCKWEFHSYGLRSEREDRAHECSKRDLPAVVSGSGVTFGPEDRDIRGGRGVEEVDGGESGGNLNKAGTGEEINSAAAVDISELGGGALDYRSFAKEVPRVIQKWKEGVFIPTGFGTEGGVGGNGSCRRKELGGH